MKLKMRGLLGALKAAMSHIPGAAPAARRAKSQRGGSARRRRRHAKVRRQMARESRRGNRG